MVSTGKHPPAPRRPKLCCRCEGAGCTRNKAPHRSAARKRDQRCARCSGTGREPSELLRLYDPERVAAAIRGARVRST